VPKVFQKTVDLKIEVFFTKKLSKPETTDNKKSKQGENL